MRHRIPCGLLVLLGLLATGCDRNVPEADDDGRLVLGESVDGVRLGDDTLAVVALWGPPSRVEWGASLLRYLYEQGPQDGVEVYYELGSFGRLSEYSGFRLTQPYDGRTLEGIGLGSRRADVLAALGEPDYSLAPGTSIRQDRYTHALGNPITLSYEDDVLREIGMLGRAQ